MKISKEKIINPVIFNPFNVSFKIESEDDAYAIYALFNHVTNSELLGEELCSNMKQEIGKQYYIGTGLITKSLSAKDFYRGRI